MNSKTWVFPSYDHLRIAHNGAVGPKVAYMAARCKIEQIDPDMCELTSAILDGQPILTFRWQPDVDKRLPCDMDTLVSLVGGVELTRDRYAANTDDRRGTNFMSILSLKCSGSTRSVLILSIATTKRRNHNVWTFNRSRWCRVYRP